MNIETAIQQAEGRFPLGNISPEITTGLLGNNYPYDPNIQDFNRVIYGLKDVPRVAKPASAAPFGSHVREGIEIIKDWVANP